MHSISKASRIIAVTLAAALLAACSSTGAIQVEKQLRNRIDHTAVASLSVTPHESMKREPAVMEAVQRLRAQLFGRLISEGVFFQVVQPGNPARYRIEASMLTARGVSQRMRIIFGFLAGSNELSVQVDVFEGGSDAALTSLVAKGKSASHPLSSENDMDDAIREAVDEIILALH